MSVTHLHKQVDNEVFEKPRVFIQDRVKKLICERRVYFFNTVFYHLLRGFDFLFVLALVDLGLYSVFGSVPGIPLFDESAGFSIYLEVAGFFCKERQAFSAYPINAS